MTLARSFTPARPLVLVGSGKMGIALLTGWLDAGLKPNSVLVIDPGPPEESARVMARKRVKHFAEVPADVTARTIVVAVKPQIIGAVLPGLRPLVGRGTVLVSVAAGTTCKSLAKGIGAPIAIRTIPNTPAMVGRGITGAYAMAEISQAGKNLAGRLLSAVGEVVWVEKEGQINAVTAVSGSGPAYVFLLAEMLAKAGVDAGLDKDTAARLARATVSGGGELLHRSDETAKQLRKNVTSPNGTTAAALEILMGKGGFEPLLRKAVAAARKRSRELSG